MKRFITLCHNGKPLLVNLNSVQYFANEGDNELAAVRVYFVSGTSIKVTETQEQIENLIRG
jgi:hypothetical protein